MKLIYPITRTYKVWCKAMQMELDEIKKNKTWQLTNFLLDYKEIGLNESLK